MIGARARRRRRAARHLTVMGLGIGLLTTAGAVSAGAVMGRWSLPFVEDPVVVFPDPSATESVTATLAADQPTCGPGGIATIAEPAATVVKVLNGTGTSGLATSTGDELRARAFQVSSVGNTGQPTAATEVRFSLDLQDQGLAVALQLPAGSLVVDPDVTEVTLVLGPDFTTLRTPEEAAAARSGQLFEGCFGA